MGMVEERGESEGRSRETLGVRRMLSVIMVGGLLLGTILAWSWNAAARERLEEQVAVARSSAQRLERQIRIEAATGRVPLNGRGWPETVDPGWFGEDPPLNPLIPMGRPWVEVAAEDEDALTDPPIRQSVSRDLAMFWYNPSTGSVRARVGPTISDQMGLEMYNRVNGVSVAALFDTRGGSREAPTLSAAQERLLAGAGSSKKQPLIVVRRTEKASAPVEEEKGAGNPAEKEKRGSRPVAEKHAMFESRGGGDSSVNEGGRRGA